MAEDEPKVSRVPAQREQLDAMTLFITWTTYGSWLPGDGRGWNRRGSGAKDARPRLERWCRQRLRSKPVILDFAQRAAVETIIGDHSLIRGWGLHAVSARTNHVHVAVTAAEFPKHVRNQLKANSTTALRRLCKSMAHTQVWSSGGHISFIDTEQALEEVVAYITQAQDRMQWSFKYHRPAKPPQR